MILGIQRELKLLTQSIASRIEKLQPWIEGHLVLRVSVSGNFRSLHLSFHHTYFVVC
jgi:hypothetical protein